MPILAVIAQITHFQSVVPISKRTVVVLLDIQGPTVSNVLRVKAVHTKQKPGMPPVRRVWPILTPSITVPQATHALSARITHSRQQEVTTRRTVSVIQVGIYPVSVQSVWSAQSILGALEALNTNASALRQIKGVA